jgi:hypothetical protein
MMRYLQHFMMIEFLLVISGKICAQTTPTSCSSFRKGIFAYRDTANNIIREFKRTHKYQVETDKLTGLTTKYKIEWVTECQYKLTQVYANKKEAREKNYSWLLYTITPVTERSYNYHCRCSDKVEIKGIVVKME